ncbi:MAG: GNAT family N-acetyltransferase [Proteobacteria bacterium]|nr:GNAT family N-acetyltransferase [Pseudomonadota bacterium]
MRIEEDDLKGPEIAALLQAHLAHTGRLSPAESMHALDLEALRAPEITFWTAWEDDLLLGCGAVSAFQPGHGEIKSMHTAAAHRGKGVAAGILSHIVQIARQRSYKRLSLETGSMAAFAPARRLYAQFGFVPCDPFGTYREDPCSVFMTLELSALKSRHAGKPIR